jgi:hypothetical protein
VDVDYTGQGELGGYVSVSYTTFMHHIPGGDGQAIWAGHNRQRINGQVVDTFGLDLLRKATTGEHLVQQPGEVFSAEASDALNALYHATNGAQVATNEEAVAFQALLWEIVADFSGAASSIDLTVGSLVFYAGVDGAIFERFKSMAFDPSRRVDDSQLRVLTRPGYQRQAGVLELFRPVPLPSGAALALAGLGIVACRRRRV